jgi:hypothetical protein
MKDHITDIVRNRKRSARVAKSNLKKLNKTKFGHKQFQKGQILKNEKRLNSGQIFIKNFLK